MQIRVLGWQQTGGKDDYRNQSDVVASPPVATILPGKRQLIRLITDPGRRRARTAYRILVDEVPIKDKDGAAPDKGAQMGLKFQMRYSVPLFVSGKGVWTKQDFEHPRDYATANQPKLSYRLLQQTASAGSTCATTASCTLACRRSASRASRSTTGCWAMCCRVRRRFALPPSGSFAPASCRRWSTIISNP